MKIVNTKKPSINLNRDNDFYEYPPFEFLMYEYHSIRNSRNQNNTTEIKKKSFIYVFLSKIKQKLLWK